MSGYRILSFDGGPAALTVLPCLIELERKSGEQCRGLLGDRSLRLGPVSLLPTNEAAMLLLLGLDEVALAFGELTALLWRVTWPAELVQWLGFQPSFTQSISWIESA